MENLHSHKLRITTRYDNLYTYDVEVEAWISNNMTKYNLKGGYAVEVFNEIVQLYDFSYEIVPDVDTYEFSKSTEFDIDVFVGSFALFDRNLEEYIQPAFITGYSRIVAFINHNFEANENDALLSPLDSKLVLSLFFMLILFCAASTVFGWFEKYTISESIFHSVSIFLNQSSNLKFKKLSARLALWTTCLTVYISWASYSGTLVSTWAVAHYFVNSLESLLKSDYTLLLERGYNSGSPIQSIAEALPQVPVMSKFLRNAKKSGFVFESFDRAILRVKDTASAYVIDEETGMSAIKNTIGYLPCNWGKIPVYDIKYPWCMYLGKMSRHKANINIGLLKLSQYGILKRSHRKWIPRHSKCVGSLIPHIPVLGLQQLHSAFYVLFLGFISSVVIFLTLEKRIFVNKIRC